MKYLIRFLPKEEYVSQLLAGKLRLRRLGYYKYDARGGRNDINEGSISQNEAGLLERLVLCMFLFETDSDDVPPTICVSREVLSDFCGDGGYAVVFPFESFCSYMEKQDSAIKHGPIVYEDDLQIAFGEVSDCVFRKDSKYKHQCEYRFLLSDYPETFWVNKPAEEYEKQESDFGLAKFSDPNILQFDTYRGAFYVCRLPPISEVYEDPYQFHLGERASVSESR